MRKKIPLLSKFTLGADCLHIWLFLYGYVTNFLRWKERET